MGQVQSKDLFIQVLHSMLVSRGARVEKSQLVKFIQFVQFVRGSLRMGPLMLKYG